MKLKKLIPELVAGIVDAGFDKEPREIQSLAVPKIKSGADLFVIAPEGSGKSTAINIGVIQQLQRPFEKAPRAIIVVSTKEKGMALDDQFEILAKHTNLRSLVVFDQGKLAYHKDMIYEGIDVLITTPKRLNDLLNNTGVPLVMVKMIVVDDAETIFQSQNHTIIHRIADAVEKVQILIFSDGWNSKFDNLAARIMKNPAVIELENERDL